MRRGHGEAHGVIGELHLREVEAGHTEFTDWRGIVACDHVQEVVDLRTSHKHEPHLFR